MTETSDKPGMGKGVLDPKMRQGKFQTQRFHPSENTRDFIKHFWEVTWKLDEDESFEQHTIPFPAVHVVFEKDRREVVGPITGRFTRIITGHGRVFGAHFRPGMFRLFTDVSQSDLVDKRPKTEDVIECDGAALEQEILALEGRESAECFDRVVQEWLQARDLTQSFDQSCLARDLVRQVEEGPSIKRANDLAKLGGLSLRSLQRLFKDAVGLTPKFVIQRFRLIEASERLLAEPGSVGSLALELGFSDQAHFIRAYKNLVGVTPGKYMKRNQ